VRARRLLVATGARDELPDVPGLPERWGRDVVHCPYCHGWEVRDRRIGVLATGPMATHQALLFRQLSDQVTMLAHTAGPNIQERERLAARAISVIEGKVVQVESGLAGLTGVRLADGRLIQLDALVVASKPVARVEFLAPLGITPQPVRVGDQVVATAIETDRTGASTVPGLWAAGNVTDPMAQVVSSAAAGLMAGAAINGDLVAEDTDRAVSGS
jgi:thioredoxin reductase